MAYESLPYIGGDTNSPEWQAKRAELFKKREGKCEDCGRTLDFSRGWNLHHKDNNPRHNSDDNLEILCKSCHYAAHPWPSRKPRVFELAAMLGATDDLVLLLALEYLEYCFSRGYEPKWHRLEQVGIKCEETDNGVVLTLGDEIGKARKPGRGQDGL